MTRPPMKPDTTLRDVILVFASMITIVAIVYAFDAPKTKSCEKIGGAIAVAGKC